MKKRIVALVMLVALSLTLFAACGKKSTIITTEQAQQIALEEIGMTAAEVDDVHVHATQYDGAACYQIHIVAGKAAFYVYINHAGEVLSVQQ